MVANLEEKTFHARRKEKNRLKSSSLSTVSWSHVLAGFVGAGYLHLVGKTSALYQFDHPQFLSYRREKKPVIYAFWHNAQVFLAYAHRDENVNILVSKSKDGEYIAQVMKRLGLNAVRGSSSRGAEQALREMCDRVSNGEQVGFTPDGPRGPVQTVQGGAIMAAQMSGAPIVPVTYVSRRRIVFNSWDKFVLPLPFSSIVTAHGKPLFIDKDTPIDQAKEKVRTALNDVVEQAEQILDRAPSWGTHLFAWTLKQLYSILSAVLLPLVFPMLVFRHGAKRSLTFMRERFQLKIDIDPGTRAVWLHAASVGEWQALKPVLNRLKSMNKLKFVITVSTPEARVIVAREEPSAIVRLAPVDIGFVVNAFIEKLRPAIVGIVETELWPNMLLRLREKNVAVVLINGRLSKRSFRHWNVFRPFAEYLLGSFASFFARTDLDGRHYVQLGAPLSLMTVSGNTKMDNLTVRVPSADSDREKQADRIARFGSADGILLVAASTWDGEEEAILEMFNVKERPNFRVIIAPRRANRFEAVRKLLEKYPISWSLWSNVKETNRWDTDILLVDTLGDLKELVRAADICFVGGSLIPRGGQNPLEAAAAGIPVLFGPSMENFHEEAAELKRQNAARQLRNTADLHADIRELAADAGLRQTMGAAGARYVASKQGASEITAAAIADILKI